MVSSTFTKLVMSLNGDTLSNTQTKKTAILSTKKMLADQIRRSRK